MSHLSFRLSLWLLGRCLRTMHRLIYYIHSGTGVGPMPLVTKSLKFVRAKTSILRLASWFSVPTWGSKVTWGMSMSL